MVREQPVSVGDKPLRWGHRKCQTKHHPPHLLEQMARLCRPCDYEPRREEANQAVCRVRHGTLQADACRQPRGAKEQNTYCAEGCLRGERFWEEAAPARRPSRPVQPGRVAREEAQEQSSELAGHGRLLVETRHCALRPHDLLYSRTYHLLLQHSPY
jgi:hypothetical protein